MISSFSKFKNIFIKYRAWLTEQKSSMQIYISAVVLFFVGAIALFMFSYSSIYIYILNYIVGTLFVLGIILDTFALLSSLEKNFVLKTILSLITTALVFYVYLQAESLAKSTIYSIVLVNPDFFPTSIAWFSGLFFIPSIFIVLSEGIIIPIFAWVFFIYIIVFAEISKKTKKYRKYLLHTFFYLTGVIILFFGSFDVLSSNILNKKFDTNYLSKQIVKTSYYENKTCRNKELDGIFIKHIEDDIISISNVTKETFNKLGEKELDNTITFKLGKCNRSLKD